jgi:hypothetical protein
MTHETGKISVSDEISAVTESLPTKSIYCSPGGALL